jgi:hypothetical protein
VSRISLLSLGSTQLWLKYEPLEWSSLRQPGSISTSSVSKYGLGSENLDTKLSRCHHGARDRAAARQRRFRLLAG